MRLWLWRRSDAHWRDGDFSNWDWPDQRRQEGLRRTLRGRTRSDELEVGLTVGLGDVALEMTYRLVESLSGGGYREARRGCIWWTLDDVPNTAETLHITLSDVLRQCGCEKDHDCRVRMISDELHRLVMNAKTRRANLLTKLPEPAPLTWSEMIRQTPEKWPGLISTYETRAVYVDRNGSIDICQSYVLSPHHLVFFRGASARIVSKRPERAVQREGYGMRLDGICCTAAVDILETFGWPNDLALSIGRAMAIKARSDWIDLLPERSDVGWGWDPSGRPRFR